MYFIFSWVFALNFLSLFCLNWSLFLQHTFPSKIFEEAQKITLENSNLAFSEDVGAGRVRRVPPYFTGKLQKVYKVGIGSHLNLTCLAVGYPMPRVFWKRQSDDSFLNDPETAPIGKNVLTLTNVERSENYSCIAVSKLGNIETSTTVEARELLPAPSGFKVVDVADCSVRLAWDPVVSSNPEDPLLGYIVKYRQKYAERGGVFKDVKIGGSETKAVIDGLEPYQQYEFVLYAASNLGKGHATLPIEIQTAETLPANPPADVKARPLNSQSVIVQWSPPEVSNGRLISYRIFYTNKEAIDENDKQGWMSKEIKAEELMVTLSSLIPDKTYYIQVQAKNSKGYGPLSKTVTVITKQGVPGQPSKLIAKPVDARRIMLSWEKPLFSYNIIGYTIRFNVSSVETKELRLTSDVQKHTVDGLNPDTLYSFRVAAHSDRGQGAFGDEVLARTLRADALTLPSLKIKAKSSKFIVFNAEDKILNNSLFVVEYRPAQEKFMDDSYEEGVDESEIEGSGMFEGLKWKTSMIDAESGVRIEDLIPNTLYEIRVKSMDNETGDSLFIKTDEDGN
uniref:Uncharacterized protein n=1 Tax=Panagrolaimus sp. JU765 TaxID=591449 RepID=A0AC34PW56_9BILA